jgi:hypothetical protein
MHTSGNNMQYSVESKSQLAKLLASENLTVEHKKVQTASFNLKDRILTCPIWKDMTGEMYDLMLGHEVGHALETPEEGWHDAVTTGKSQFSKNFKQFLNVIEDARIEKKIKRKFPGIKPSFIKAYGQLLDRDFFGIKNENVNALPFIDRLNLFTKGGYNLGIEFNTTEESFLREVESCESWEDVVRVTGAIFEYSKKEQQDINKNKQDAEIGNYKDSDDDYYSDGNDYEYEESDEMSEDAVSKKTDDEFESDDEDYVNEINRHKPTGNSNDYDDDFEPACETDETFRDNEALLLDAKSKEFIYLNIPKFYPQNSITPYKRVHELMENHWTNYYANYNMDIRVTQDTLLKEFKNRNDRYVSLLAKEFEMRKAASKFSKQQVSETGDIDISRIYKYQVDDNIFRKMMRIPKGKSHGLVLLLDRSGSMDGNMQSSIEQILILTMFCRKVNIPFVVYGFGNCTSARQKDLGTNASIQPCFSKDAKDLFLSDVYMREYMNSRMGNAEFNRCLRNMVSLMNSYMPRFQRKIDRPHSETLSNTPMIEAMIASRYITNEFRKVNNLDLVNMVLIHDGDADTVNGYFTGEFSSYGSKQNNWFSDKTQSVVIRDTQSKFETLLVSEEKSKDNDPMRTAIFNWYRQVTGAKIVGFFLIGTGVGARAAIQRKYISGNETPQTEEERHDYNKSHNRWLKEKEEAREMAKVIKTTKFLESKNNGYNKFFLIPGGSDLDIEEDELAVDGNVTAAKLRNAFIKMNKKKQVSRVLVNRFIGEIAM